MNDETRAELDVYRAEGRAHRAELDAFRAEVRAYRDEVITWRERLEVRFDELDREVGAIARRLMDGDT
jgi:hypothetical protein